MRYAYKIHMLESQYNNAFQGQQLQFKFGKMWLTFHVKVTKGSCMLQLESFYEFYSRLEYDDVNACTLGVWALVFGSIIFEVA